MKRSVCTVYLMWWIKNKTQSLSSKATVINSGGRQRPLSKWKHILQIKIILQDPFYCNHHETYKHDEIKTNYKNYKPEAVISLAYWILQRRT